ncbi:hypothetical protein FIBSPDRAFT_953004 [Athelia psychrophila]|uniref:Uncharacterized protein n=1 Tax=Athelia psychrophila TaxID=1759441 RepID=A0A166KYY4_9AGAM|nr:hypothetical protein FIBSPDRAFT_953004 [Fibularhizoctonia sp. CBS 109695]
MTETTRAQPATSFNTSGLRCALVSPDHKPLVPSDHRLVNPGFILDGFVPDVSNCETARLSLLQHADKKVKILKTGALKAREQYQGLLEATSQSLENLQRQENILNQAVMAYAYFQTSLADPALARKADVLRVQQLPQHVFESDTDSREVVYYSHWPKAIRALPRQTPPLPDLSRSSSATPTRQ